MDVYLLVGHHQRPSDRSDIQVYLKLPAQGSELMVRLSKAYRQMPDPLRLVVLFSVYDKMQDDEIAELLQCSREKVRHILKLADKIFAESCEMPVSADQISLMLQSEIDQIEISEEIIDRVRKTICERFTDNDNR